MDNELLEAAENLLSNVALDWYVQQVARPEAPTVSSSGIAAKVHNSETAQRAAAAFERLRKAVAHAKRVNQDE